MALTLSIGSTKKRHNSMLVPSLNSSISVVLKDSTSVENPVFQLQGNFDAGWNYCHCADFGRYYWITDASFDRGIWYIACTTDYLASYKDEILANTCYVTRSASLYNEYLIDTLFPSPSQPTISVSSSAALGVSESGCIVICTAGKSGNSFYAVTPANFSRLMNYLFSENYLTSLNALLDTPETVQKELAHPEEYLLSATWLPLSLSGAASISLGYVDTGVHGMILQTGSIWGQTLAVTIPKHPNSEGYKYRNLAPFSRYSLYIPFYGTIGVDPSDIAEATTIYVNYNADINGALYIGVITNKGVTLFSGQGNFGAPVGVSGRNTNTIGTVSTALSSVGNLLTGNVLGAASSIVSAFESVYPHVYSSGGTGGTMLPETSARLTAQFFAQTTIDVTRFGRPLCQPTPLSGLSGYCRTEGASVSCGATDTGIKEINRMLDGGVYIE